MDYLSFKEFICYLINKSNNTSIYSSQVEMSSPEVYRLKDNVNTSVVISALPDSGGYGNKTVYYQRKELSGTVYLPTSSIVDKTTLLSNLNELLGVETTETDFYPFELPLVDISTPVPISLLTLTVMVDNYLYTGLLTVVFTNEFVQSNTTVNEKYLYVFLKDIPIEQTKQSCVAIGTSGVKHPYFNYLGNVTAIQRYTPESITQRSSGEFILIGDFSFTIVKPAMVEVVEHAKVIIVDRYGMVIHYDMNQQFTTNDLIKDPYSQYHYNLTNGLKRYTDLGRLDNYTPAITNPFMIRFGKQGKVYTVEEQVSGFVINRLYRDGSIDATFNRITISSKDELLPLLCYDIIEDNLGDVYIHIKSPYGYAFTNVYPVINAVDYHKDYKSVVQEAWNPVLKFTGGGGWDSSFLPVLSGYHPSIVEDVDTTFTQNSNTLLHSKDCFIYLTYRSNPHTGYKHIIPTRLTTSGKVSYNTDSDYSKLYKWNKVTNVFNANGKLIIVGSYQVLSELGYVESVLAIASYNDIGLADKVVKTFESDNLLKVFLDV